MPTTCTCSIDDIITVSDQEMTINSDYIDEVVVNGDVTSGNIRIHGDVHARNVYADNDGMFWGDTDQYKSGPTMKYASIGMSKDGFFSNRGMKIAGSVIAGNMYLQDKGHGQCGKGSDPCDHICYCNPKNIKNCKNKKTMKPIHTKKQWPVYACNTNDYSCIGGE